MTYICICTGEDIGTVPARAVCFKRVHIKDFIIFQQLYASLFEQYIETPSHTLFS